MWRRMIASGRDACASRRLDELAVLQAQRLAAHDARHVEPVDRADRDEDQHEMFRPKNTISRITKNMNGSA